jgi:putative ABC transport system permease protein
VRSATVATGLPPTRTLNANDIAFEGKTPSKDGPAFNIDFYNTVGDGYFETMGIRLVEGRFFDGGDTTDSMPVVVINQQLARRFFPGEKALGRRLRDDDKSPWYTIVGVVADVKQQGIEAQTGTELYWPMRQLVHAFPHANRVMSVVVRSDLGNARALERSVRGAVAEIDPILAVAKLATMDERLYDAVAKPRFVTTLLGLLAGLALVLAAIGIYGVMSYAVSQRTSEIGIRLALGAEARDILGMIVGGAARLAAIGLAIGVALALALGRTLSSLLYETAGTDPLTFAAVVAVLGGVAIAASYFPARRASRIPPVDALRAQ